MMRSMPRLDLGSLSFLLLVGCVTGRGSTQGPVKTEPPDPGPLAEKWRLPSKIVSAAHQREVSEQELMKDLLTARVVYIAEKHHSPHDHAVQLLIVDALRKKDPALSIGLEMVKRPFQKGLDRYLAGEIDETEFLAEVEWSSRWGFPFFLYRPILRYARKHRLKVYALNAPDEITRKTAREGLDALSSEERASVPDLDLSNEAHRSSVRAAFDGHHGSDTKMTFENFYTAQVIWDETMAYEVARILRQEPGHRMVVLAGAGHIRHGHGIPSRAAKRGATPHQTVLPVLLKKEGPTYEEVIREPAADFLWLMGEGLP